MQGFQLPFRYLKDRVLQDIDMHAHKWVSTPVHSLLCQAPSLLGVDDSYPALNRAVVGSIYMTHL
jgi:hypothetical protein